MGHTGRERGKVAIQAAARYMQDMNVYRYELLLLPIRVDLHCTSVAVDMVALPIIFFDSTHEGGSEHI